LVAHPSAKDGMKFQYALKWNIRVVREEWFWECCKNGHCVSEDPYLWVDQQFETMSKSGVI
jgi:hypothetical protein